MNMDTRIANIIASTDQGTPGAALSQLLKSIAKRYVVRQ